MFHVKVWVYAGLVSLIFPSQFHLEIEYSASRNLFDFLPGTNHQIVNCVTYAVLNISEDNSI